MTRPLVLDFVSLLLLGCGGGDDAGSSNDGGSSNNTASTDGGAGGGGENKVLSWTGRWEGNVDCSKGTESVSLEFNDEGHLLLQAGDKLRRRRKAKSPNGRAKAMAPPSSSSVTVPAGGRAKGRSSVAPSFLVGRKPRHRHADVRDRMGRW